jgi:TetR/AcrR family transcriptional regulator, transcriptional repressor for nem operon
MPRHREFDPEVALEEAMRLFWRKGYHDTSVRDLVAGTGVSHAGLYGTFGNKEEVFTAALKRYQEEVMHRLMADLTVPDASLPEVVGHFERLFELGRDPRFREGCMLCNAAVDRGQTDPEIAARMAESLDESSAAFRQALIRAKEKGEVRADLDPAAAADVLTSTKMAMSLMLRAKVDFDRIVAFGRSALSTVI